jgi:hypothetical protein
VAEASFNQVARLCHQGRIGPLSLPRARSTLALVDALARDVLQTATDLGYLEQQGDEWTLSERGARLGVEMEVALGRARESSSGNLIRPYTEYLPTGSEELS